MLPTNVMSFMKKMVTTNESSTPDSSGNESGTALSKLRQTLSSSLMTAQDKVTKLGPARQAAPPEIVATPTDDKSSPKTEDATSGTKSQNSEAVKPPCRTGTCRVCLKSFKPEDFFRICFECQQKVCEDCASYSKLDENQDESTWRCSICRRKMQSRAQPVMSQESTDSLLDVPVLEALQRRHSDAKINPASSGGKWAGLELMLPRTLERRRHSDVSPSALKELSTKVDLGSKMDLTSAKTPEISQVSREKKQQSQQKQQQQQQSQQQKQQSQQQKQQQQQQQSQQKQQQQQQQQQKQQQQQTSKQKQENVKRKVSAADFGLAPPSRSPDLRRHSDVSTSSLKELQRLQAGGAGGGGGGGLGAGLAPPRSPELRRHSDVSPASLKELEKVAGERREELRWEREMEWRQHGKPSPGASRVGSPQSERRNFSKPEERAPQQQPVVTVNLGPEDGGGDDPEAWRRRQGRSRRMSRVQRQHSYDDDIKNAGGGGGGGPSGGGEPALGLPVQLPRRASAYDVYAAREGGVAITPAPVSRGQQPSPQSSSRYGTNGDTGEDGPSPTSRRPSFRAGKPPGLYDFDDPDSGDKSVFDASSSPLSPEAGSGSQGGLLVDEDRRTRRRGSQLPDLAALQARQAQSTRAVVPTTRGMDDMCNVDTVRRQASVTAGEDIKIVIHDVDSESNFSTRPGSKRRVVLRRDPSDKAHRTRGFGMRVVGGKTGNDGRLFAYIVWTVPGGPAEKGGLQQGDKVLEWDGVPLVDRSFEEVCAVMDRTGDVAELLVEHSADLRMCELLDDPSALVSGGSRRVSAQGEALGVQLESEQDKTPTSPTRRKLPKTPEQMAREKQVSGRIQLQVFYHDEKQELVVSVLAADDLAPREDTGYGTLPEAYVKLRLMPVTGEHCCAKSDVAEPTHNPIWNATFDFPNVPGEELMDRTIEVTLWDYCPDRDSIFLGECTVDLKKAFLEDRPVWYRLEDPRQLRGSTPGKSPHTSPRTSLANEVAQRLLRRAEFGQQRSFSDDRESDDKGSSPELNFLHPDHAWLALSASGSRRGSSQSEQLEVETYQLGRDFSRSLPGSRRSSFQSAQDKEKADADIPVPTYTKERRRSSVSRVPRDPEEILRQLKAVKGEMMLGRSMSITGDKRTQQRRCSADNVYHTDSNTQKPRPQRTRSRDAMMPPARLLWHKDRRESVMELPEKGIISSLADEEERTGIGTGKLQGNEDEIKLPEVNLGPGQIHPRGYRLTTGRFGEIKLGLLMTKGQLEVEVICARNIACEARESPPDTYVKTYLRDGERWLQKRKTRVVRHSNDPQYRQTLRYSACDVLGRTLLVMLWERQKGFEHNIGIGGAEIALDKITLTHLTTGWYPLFPIHSLGSDSNDSP